MANFNKWVFISLSSVYFLIFVGSLVRASGAGMGCPDWPKCYGQIIPPTSQEQIDDGLEEILTAKRVKKYQRFLSVINSVNLSQFLVVEGYDVYASQPFNATKTWIEYLNRLCGVAVGFIIIVLLFKALRLKKYKIKYALLVFLLLLVTMFEGFIGSLVVAANLLPGIITVHMFFALIMVGLLIMIFVQTKGEVQMRYFSSKIYLFAMVVLFCQVLLGTTVREEVDLLLKNIVRDDIIDNLGLGFIIHRSFSWLLLAGSVYLYYKTPKDYSWEKKLNLWALILIGISFLTGVLMDRIHLPFIIQPIHLVQATLLLGIYFYQLYCSKVKNEVK